MAEDLMDGLDPIVEGEPSDRQQPAVEGELMNGLTFTVEGNPGNRLDIAMVIIYDP